MTDSAAPHVDLAAFAERVEAAGQLYAMEMALSRRALPRRGVSGDLRDRCSLFVMFARSAREHGGASEMLRRVGEGKQLLAEVHGVSPSR